MKLVVPLVSQGELIGLINLGSRLSEQEYSSDDRKLLGNLATQAAPALRVAQLVQQQKVEAAERERIEQELKVARSGVVGNVTVLDPAETPRRPARPRRSIVLSLALLFGLGVGVIVALGRRAFSEGADDPDEIEARTGLPVFVMIPHSDTEARLDREARRVPGAYRTSLAEAAPDDLAIEGPSASDRSCQCTGTGLLPCVCTCAARRRSHFSR